MARQFLEQLGYALHCLKHLFLRGRGILRQPEKGDGVLFERLVLLARDSKLREGFQIPRFESSNSE